MGRRLRGRSFSAVGDWRRPQSSAQGNGRAISRVLTLYVQCFCVFVSLAPSVAHQLSAGPAKKNDR